VEDLSRRLTLSHDGNSPAVFSVAVAMSVRYLRLAKVRRIGYITGSANLLVRFVLTVCSTDPVPVGAILSGVSSRVIAGAYCVFC
jgi:hypothetical protein